MEPPTERAPVVWRALCFFICRCKLYFSVYLLPHPDSGQTHARVAPWPRVLLTCRSRSCSVLNLWAQSEKEHPKGLT